MKSLGKQKLLQTLIAAVIVVLTTQGLPVNTLLTNGICTISPGEKNEMVTDSNLQRTLQNKGQKARVQTCQMFVKKSIEIILLIYFCLSSIPMLSLRSK
jgi:hypothetical protein